MSEPVKMQMPDIKWAGKVERINNVVSVIAFIGTRYSFQIYSLVFLSKAIGRGFEYKRLGTLKIFKQTAKLPSRRLIRTRIKHFERMMK